MSVEKLKLYVWEGVLTDYTDGIMFAYALDEKHAREMILEKCDWVIKSDLEKEPREIIKEEAIILWGGS